MKLRSRAVSLPCSALLLVGLTACEVAPTNAFDPDTPPEFQALADVHGTVQAVFEPDEDGSVPDASFCARREGDHSGFRILLRALVSGEGQEPLLALSEETTESGEFVFLGVPAGPYALEIVRPDFHLPLPRSIDVRPGEDLRLAPVCAINASAPAAPAIDALPAEVGATAPGAPAATLRLLLPSAKLRYTVEQLPDGEAEGAPAPIVVEDALSNPEVPLELSLVDAAPARRAWRVRVTAEDALGNRSPPTEAVIVRDTLAPPAVDASTVQVVAGLDRVSASWPTASWPLDDAPARWLVSYGLVPRLEDPGASCPFGAPSPNGDDPLESAAFAVEGASPVASSVPALTLSGILPGTDVYLHVAALDRAGNASCYSAPVVTRPDEVTPVLVDDVSAPAISGARAIASLAGAYAFARGGGGLSVVDRGGTVHDAVLPLADDVVAAEGAFFVASGAQLRRVALDAGGAPGSITDYELGTSLATAVVARPGRVLIGTSRVAGDGGSLRSLSLEDGTLGAEVLPAGRDAAISTLLARGDRLALVREPVSGASTAPRTLEIVDLADLTVVRGTTTELPGAPTRARLIGDQLWLTFDSGLRLFDLSACGAGATDCLPPARVMELPDSAVPRDVVGWDDLVLVAADGGGVASAGGVYLFSTTPGVHLVGRAFTADAAFAPERLVLHSGGFCALGRTGTEASSLCWSATQQAIAARQLRILSRGDVSDVAHAGTDGWLSETIGAGAGTIAALTRVSLEDGAVLQHAEAPPPGAGSARFTSVAALPDVGAVALDSTGRLFFAPLETGSSHASPALLDEVLFGGVSFAEGLFGLGVDAPLDSYLHLEAGVLYLAARQDAADAEVVVAAVRLREELGGVHATLLSSEVLASADLLTRLLVTGGKAYVSTFPSGVSVLDVSDPAAISALAAESVAVGTGPGDGVVDVAWLGSASEGRALVVSQEESADSTASARVDFLAEGGALTPLGLGFSRPINTVVGFGERAAVGVRGAGVFLLDVVDSGDGELALPVLQLPQTPLFREMVATGRGLLVADGPAGAAWTALR